MPSLFVRKNGSTSVLALIPLLVQFAAGLPARSQTRLLGPPHFAQEPDVEGRTTRQMTAVRPYKAVDWSRAMVDSTMKRFTTAKDLGSWGYAKSLYLYGEYLVWKRTRDPRYLQYIKDWVDSHVDANGILTNTNAEGKTSEIAFDNLDSVLPGNLLLVLYQETKDPKYKLVAEKIRKRFDTYPRTTDGGFWHATSNSREWQLWGDGGFMSMPFLVRYC